MYTSISSITYYDGQLYQSTHGKPMPGTFSAPPRPKSKLKSKTE